MLHILFQDDHYVAIHKPAGLLVHRSSIDIRERQFALQKVRDQIEQKVYPIHRLDKPTSGVLLFGLSSEAAKAASTLFEQQAIQKTYLALVRGYTEESGEIDHPISWIPETKKEKKASIQKEPQSALTHFSLVSKTELPFPVGRYETCRYSLVSLTPKTGRKHQLRRHMKHISHPIVGDTRHGDWRHNRFVESQFGCHRMLLHASELQFTHPFTDEAVRIHAPLDEEFSSTIAAMELADPSGP
ncbi:MAG: tRNA pseudouridine(65) synthase TruC [Rhodothermaceae bacterium]|nr:tRNA pseudouridine(65) synthase TruC [Rhodothermaceae bacterium]